MFFNKPTCMTQQGKTTRLLHTPFPEKDPYGSLNFPTYDSVAFEFDTAEDLEEAFTGKVQKHQYSRITNPTVEYLEHKVQNLTGAFTVTAMASGMAAISNLVMALARSGDNVITSRHLFGNTLAFFEKTLKPYGLETRYADMTDPASVEALIDDRSVAIFFETITNPQMEVASIRKLSEVAEKHGLVLIADSTMTPPSLFSAREFGINFELLSSTKFISGGATSVGGLLIDYGTFDWSSFHKTREGYKEHGQVIFKMMFRKQVYRNMGACMSPHNAYLQSLGLDTLTLRTERATSNALELAGWLEAQPKVKAVNHPGLESSPFKEISRQQFGTKPCSMFTFDLANKAACYHFMNQLEVVRRATNLQDNKSLIIHPYSTIFAEYTEEQKARMGLRDSTIRISVGIEDLPDLIADMEQALTAL